MSKAVYDGNIRHTMSTVISYAIFALYLFVVLYTIGLLLYLGFREHRAERKRQLKAMPPAPEPAPVNFPKAA